VIYNNSSLAILDAAGTRSDFALLAMVQFPITGLLPGPGNTLYAAVANTNSVYKLVPSILETGLQPGDVVFTSSVNIAGIGLDDSSVSVDLGGWTPTVSGDYLVEVAAGDPQTSGLLSNTLHVGPSATGTLGLAQVLVLPGDRSVVGSLTVVGADSTSVTRIDPQGTSLAARSGVAGRAIAADSSGNIYAAGLNKIVKITPDGSVSDFVTGITVGNGLAVDSQSNIYAVSGSNVLKITPQAQVQTLATLGGQAMAVATDLNDRVYAVDLSNKLSRILPDGTVATLPTVGLTSPRALSIDPFGNFYIVNSANEILRVPSGGQTSELYLGQVSFEGEGINITADCSNNLLFAPTLLPPYKSPGGEEDTILQIVGDTGEVREVVYGPDIDPGLSDMDVLFSDRIGDRLLI